MPVPAVTGKLGSTIGGKLVELTVEPILKEIGYVIFYRHNLTEHEDALKELKNRRDVVQIRVDEARRQGEEIYGQVKDWISKADEITSGVCKGTPGLFVEVMSQSLVTPSDKQRSKEDDNANSRAQGQREV
ncbi:unnamed protein product [Cuscuta campestris]|uniref:Uncharacterized protein n=1 Tax=Cuscuta campestris TaxID=132261 RepID=A0A484LG55_9ASTE|nr:unnamed protein product [Cuscuta campestris]